LDEEREYMSLAESKREEEFFDAEIRFPSCNEIILSNLRGEKFDSKEWFDLNTKAEKIMLSKGFDRLLSLDYLRGWQPFEHQKETALKVIREMRGRALLADEVGLGKTIEAGLILKEYMVRGLVKKALVLAPASLLSQWVDELKVKFDLDFRINNDVDKWEKMDRVVGSLDTAKRPKHAEEIFRIRYDMVIVDEAHKLKNNSTLNWHFVDQLNKKYILMLTATPIQNDLKELYNMITLLKPGQLKTFSYFREHFMEDKRTPKNPIKLKRVLNEVMVRNRRNETGIRFPKRYVHTVALKLSNEEKHFYEKVTSFTREEYMLSIEANKNYLPLITLQKLASSSSRAASMTLAKMSETASGRVKERLEELMVLALEIKESQKAVLLEKMLKNLEGKAIVFTEFRGTQMSLKERLEQAGISCVLYNGGLNYAQKDEVIKKFKESAQVLISTEAGGEGRNLQFCNNLVNYDLPWNPMKLEQRIGRIHRLGQTQDVNIFNFSAEGTVEAHILYLLNRKINMFELVVGELDLIISNLQSRRSFERTIFEIVAGSSSAEEMDMKIEMFGDEILQACKAFEYIRSLDQRIFAEM
jgi:SNF2 family DNA or RNA helicase